MTNPHKGSSFDDFAKDENIIEVGDDKVFNYALDLVEEDILKSLRPLDDSMAKEMLIGFIFTAMGTDIERLVQAASIVKQLVVKLNIK